MIAEFIGQPHEPFRSMTGRTGGSGYELGLTISSMDDVPQTPHEDEV